MSFFKKNSYDITRLYINQIGITIFSLVLYFAVGTIKDDDTFWKARLLVSLFSFVFYLCLIYTILWELGSKDKIRIESGRMISDKTKGIKLSLLANAPNFLLSLISIIFVSLYLASSSEVIKSIFSVFYLILRVHGSMFFGFILNVTSTVADAKTAAYFVDCLIESILYFALPLISVLVSHLAYILGTKEKKLFSFLKSKKK